MTAWNQKLRGPAGVGGWTILARARIFIESKNLFLFIYFVAYEEGKVPNSRKTFHNPAERDERARKFFLESSSFSLEKSEKSRLEIYFKWFFFFFWWAEQHIRKHTTAGFLVVVVGCCCDLNEPSVHCGVTSASRFPAMRSTSAAQLNSTHFFPSSFFFYFLNSQLINTSNNSSALFSSTFVRMKGKKNTCTRGNFDHNLSPPAALENIQ